MIERFKDFYGCTATIHPWAGSYFLRIFGANGRQIHRKAYATRNGARIAMGKWSDCWEKA